MKQVYVISAVMAGITLAGAVAGFLQSTVSGVIVLVTGAVLTAIYLIITLRRYKDISELSEYLYRVLNGLDALDVRDNREGELSILKNNIRKATVMLRSQTEMLKKEKIWLSDSLADISHQLKTPITSIIVMTDLLMGGDLPEEKQREFITNIERQTKKMQWLITTLLKISKFDAGTVTLKSNTVNIKDVAENAVKPFSVQMELRCIRLDMRLSDAYFIGDYDWTLEAVENIIKNCIEHMKENDVLTITTKDNPLYTYFEVADTGCGIEKEDLPHIFERFYKGKNSSPDSVGIGLALSKSVFNRENARIDALSEKGTGTTFKIYFYKNVL